MNNDRRLLLPFVLLFVLLNAFFITGKSFLLKRDIDQEVLIVGNLVLCAATLLSFWISVRSHRVNTGSSAVRGLYGSFMAKFFLIAVSAFVYIIMAREHVNKNGLFILAGLYIVYTVMEVRLLTRLLRVKKNG